MTHSRNDSENWAERAARLGWDAMALFGCAPKRPLDYSGSAGLLWAINGGRLGLPRFRGQARSWDQGIWSDRILSSSLG
jgi:hypothetical protein